MTPERWQEIERVYHEARQREPSERTTYLDAACGGDATLRAEIESLLRYDQHAAQFIEPPHGYEPRSPIAGMMARLHDAAAPGRFAGQVLGSYEVTSLIAAGGMGEVYRATDVRLDRVVAIKILPDHLAEDPERRERFTREAKIISSLNHPHICALYDVGVQDRTQFLVMEYVDGETLHDRIQRGPVPLKQALEFLIQIAEALDKAHRHGIVHRDLKPGNIMLTKSGVKLLDFGLAARRVRSSPASGDLLTTDSAQALTVAGTIRGTVQYMAPEQLHGQPSDARTDIFAFGAVAYEMLTAKPAFEGTSRAGLIGAILRDEPTPITDLVPDIPSSLARPLTRCLAKDPDERWQTANDLLFQLRSLSQSSDGVSVTRRRRARTSLWRERAGWIAAVGAISVGAFYWRSSERPQPQRESISSVTRVEFSVTPAEGTLLSGPDLPFALSPDGRYVTYVAVGRDGTARLFIHSLSSNDYKLLAGTEGASTPFWSPDSQWIGFFAANSLKKVRVSTGLAQTIAHRVSTTFSGASWSVHDDIVFPSFVGTLTRVAANGGPLADLGIERAYSPHFLPDGRHFLYAVASPPSIRLGVLGEEQSQTLMSFPVRISPVAYASGHVFFVQDGTLYARAFDMPRLAVSGATIRIADDVPTTTPARAPFSVSNAGVVAYSTFALGTTAVLRWFDRAGRPSTVVDGPQRYRGFDISGDGQRIVFSRISNTGSALWMRDLSGTKEAQITFDESFTPQLSVDGSRLLFSGPGPAPPPKLFMRTLVSDDASLVATGSAIANFAADWSGDGRSVVSVRIDRTNRLDVWHQLLPMGPEQRLPFNTNFAESQAKVSPDNRWIAFVTDRSGKDEVWVADFPSGENARVRSRQGGSFPQWSARGKELVYVNEDKQLVAVPFNGGLAGNPEVLFRVEQLADIDRIVIRRPTRMWQQKTAAAFSLPSVLTTRTWPLSGSS